MLNNLTPEHVIVPREATDEMLNALCLDFEQSTPMEFNADTAYQPETLVALQELAALEQKQ